MYNTEIVNFALSISQMVTNSDLNITDMVSFVNSVVSQLLKLMNDDPISSVAYNYGKSEFEIARNILKNIQYEGDCKGALQRAIGHLETAKIPIVNYYKTEVSSFNNGVVSIMTALPPYLTEPARIIHLDIVRIAFYELICHVMTNSRPEKLKIILSDVPVDSDYSFYRYTAAISQLFSSEEWAHITKVRKRIFLSSILPALERAEGSYRSLTQNHLDEYNVFDHLRQTYHVSANMTRNVFKQIEQPEQQTKQKNYIKPPLIQFVQETFEPEELKQLGIDDL